MLWVCLHLEVYDILGGNPGANPGHTRGIKSPILPKVLRDPLEEIAYKRMSVLQECRATALP